MTKDEVESLTTPSQQDADAVTTWLRHSGVTQMHTDGTYITFATTASQANQLLNTTFSYFSGYGQTKLRTMSYSLPDGIAPHIDIITPTTYFGSTKPQKPMMPKLKPKTPRPSQAKRAASKRQVDASCQTSITPNCVKELHNVQNYTADEKYGSRVAFGSFLNGSALYSDLAAYEHFFSLPARNFSVELINGGVNYQGNYTNVGEADLDVQNIVGITTGSLPVLEYITGGQGPTIPNLDQPTPEKFSNEPYVPYFQYLLSQENDKIPQAISNSYGDDEQTVPVKYAQRTCTMIGMLVSRGFTVLESSGDTGVGGPCLSNDGKKTPQFTP